MARASTTLSRAVRAPRSDSAGALLTIYTRADETFATLAERSGSPTGLIRELNPHVRALEELEGGIPLDLPYFEDQVIARRGAGQSPYDVAKREKSLGVSEFPAPGADNPRILLYHASTQGGAMPDEVSWCSSFVNYCVEQSGTEGTNSKAARSWLEWGRSVDHGDWREGDIVVFWREAPSSWKGHVAFLVTWDGSRPFVLGGNQGNRICVDDPYPFGQILSVRRAG